MSHLVAVIFDDEATAFEMRAALVKMQKEYLVELEDAVVVTRDQKGKTRLDQAVNLTSAGAVGGGFWGMLVGVLFPFALTEPYFQSLDQSPIDKCADRYYFLASFERGTDISRGLSI